MAEWPVQIAKHADTRSVDPVPPGETVTFIRFRSGLESVLAGYIALCPKCGTFGTCHLTDYTSDGSGWTADEENGLTMRPSILCKCGGHFWLTDGILREV